MQSAGTGFRKQARLRKPVPALCMAAVLSLSVGNASNLAWSLPPSSTRGPHALHRAAAMTASRLGLASPLDAANRSWHIFTCGPGGPCRAVGAPTTAAANEAGAQPGFSVKAPWSCGVLALQRKPAAHAAQHAASSSRCGLVFQRASMVRWVVAPCDRESASARGSFLVTVPRAACGRQVIDAGKGA
eukprot:NODE_15034_length_1072_cov_1.685714.p1 GENE.NODE_15034_length_1072_cov_1.685714~~NODE_15034_length_1072_cov_1.685714.p1  ORF type:complete len:187 (-),score=23.72 NODE_15034_length_1072_cov_1.685714:512-1072(-)